MQTPPLNKHLIADAAIRDVATAGNHEAALRLAGEQAAAGLTHQAILRLIRDKNVDAAVAQMEQALNLAPTSQIAFHNLVATLLQNNRLKGHALRSMKEFMANHWTETQWLPAYRPLLWQPRWINLEFVSGKCNLKCRMCLGTNSDTYPNKFNAMPADEFRRALEAAPTVDSITLSSGDSDPFLHPDIIDIIDIAKERDVLLSFFTNGHALDAKLARKIVDTQTVEMVNFSIDAATTETYTKVRGGDFDRLKKRVDMLATMKRDKDARYPNISFSFVAMKDTIAELPDYVSWAIESGAIRVLVEDLIGWEDIESDNKVATDHPDCYTFIAEAKRRAEEARIVLSLPERLQVQPELTSESTLVTADTGQSLNKDASSKKTKLPCCSWVDGFWVQKDGKIDPCCLVHDVTDMGNVHDGPVIGSESFGQVKSELMDGKVFKACANQRMCEYVQQQKTAGKPLRFIEGIENRDDSTLVELNTAAVQQS